MVSPISAGAVALGQPVPTGTAASTTATTAAQGSFLSAIQSIVGGNSATQSPMFNPTTTNTSYLTQTSQPDITSMINATMQQLLGRYATNDEIQRYGSELLAAERANTGSYSGTTRYDNAGATPNRRNQVTGQQTTTGVDAQSFIANLINGTGEARDYKAATGYFDAMRQSNEKFRGSLNG